jgi:hypothetical protein
VFLKKKGAGEQGEDEYVLPPEQGLSMYHYPVSLAQ